MSKHEARQQYGICVPSESTELLWAACQRGHVADVCSLLSTPSQQVDAGANESFALRVAAKRGYVGIVRALLALPTERGVDAAARHNEALSTAAEHGHVEVVRELLELPPHRGVDVTDVNNRVIRCVAHAGRVSMVRMLTDASTQPRAAASVCDDNTLLWNLLCGAGLRGYCDASPEQARDVLRYLMLEMPGGERCMDNPEVGKVLFSSTRYRYSARFARLAVLSTAARQRREWKRRRTLLLLRCLSDLHRATCRYSRARCYSL